MKNKISVVVCTRDRQNHLKKCVHSLLNQSHRPREIIIVDDASKDEINVIDLLQNLSSSLRRAQRINGHVDVILLRNKKRQGVIKSRNMGISASTGDIIAFIDDDGYAHRNWIRNLVRNYSKGVVGVGGPVIEKSRSKDSISGKKLSYITGEGEIKHHYRVRSFGECRILPKQYVKFLMGGNMSFRKDVLLRVKGGDAVFKGNYYREETDLCMRISRMGKLIFEPSAATFHETAKDGGTRDIATVGSFLYWYFRNSTLLFLRNFDFHDTVQMISRHAKSYIAMIKSGDALTNREYLKNESKIKIIVSIYKGIFSGFTKGFLSRKVSSRMMYRKPEYVIAARVRFHGDRIAIIRQEGILKSVETLIRI